VFNENTKFVVKRFYKRHETKYNDYWRRISGLSVGLHLHREGFPVKIIEASDRAGGRIKTDSVNGFRLDRGFQVLLTSYPEAQMLLDYEALQLKTLPGATVL
jgi:phytoene dehydrogenase-like protein